MFRPSRIEISRQALKNNLQLLQKWNGNQAFFCPMVKANAYGHGAVIVAKIVQETGASSALGVALIEEGLDLREAGIEMPILTFASLNAASASALMTHQLTPVVGRMADLEALVSVCGRGSVEIHLKFNTGMNRLGFDEDELPQLRAILQKNPQLKVVGKCTHLSHGNEVDQAEGITQRQLARLERLSQGFPGVSHAHKSSTLCTLARQGLSKNPTLGSRPGISLYGIPHDLEQSGPGLMPVLRWKSHLLRTHVVEKGESVSYSGRWVAPRRSVIGVLPVGYGDGYMRANSNKGQMLFRETRVPVVGSVCMDYTLIDLTDVKNGSPQPGEEVVLIGRQGAGQVTAVELAQWADTIAYEVVTGIGPRTIREVQ